MIRLAVRCRAEDCELVLAELLELAPGGIEERNGDGWVEYAIYGAPGELPALPELEAAAGGSLVEVTSSELADDWAERWRQFHRPVAIAGGRLVVRPPWAAQTVQTAPTAFHSRRTSRSMPPSVDFRTFGGGGGARRTEGGPGGEGGGAVEVVIDPGQAFGTGAHATTALCLELLVELADGGAAHGALADLGTGSGVLAIAAAKLGWDPVFGFDSEPAALAAAAENAAANRVALRLERLDLRADPLPAAPTAVANLTGPLLSTLAARLGEPPAQLVCSGLLASEREGVAVAFERRGLELVASREAGEWAGLRFERA